jgi:hypothetical protein
VPAGSGTDAGSHLPAGTTLTSAGRARLVTCNAAVDLALPPAPPVRALPSSAELVTLARPAARALLGSTPGRAELCSGKRLDWH